MAANRFSSVREEMEKEISSRRRVYWNKSAEMIRRYYRDQR